MNNKDKLKEISQIKQRVEDSFLGIYGVLPHIHREECIGLDLICREGIMTKTIQHFLETEYKYEFVNAKCEDVKGTIRAFFR